MVLKNKKDKRSVSNFPHRPRGKGYSMYRLISAVGFLLICVLLVIIVAQYVRYQQTQAELREYEERIKKNEMRKEMAELKIDRLEDYDYIEILARERLGLIRPNETIFRLED
ncbi:MAG: septum formation initiator family protein [Bacillota bacterium]